MKRSEMQTVKVRPAPVILVVGGSNAFSRRCNDIAVQGQAIAFESDVASFATIAKQTRALAVVMLKAIYEKNAAILTAMAKDAGTKIIVVRDEAIAQADLEAHFSEILSPNHPNSD